MCALRKQMSEGCCFGASFPLVIACLLPSSSHQFPKVIRHFKPSCHPTMAVIKKDMQGGDSNRGHETSSRSDGQLGFAEVSVGEGTPMQSERFDPYSVLNSDDEIPGHVADASGRAERNMGDATAGQTVDPRGSI